MGLNLREGEGLGRVMGHGTREGGRKAETRGAFGKRANRTPSALLLVY